MDRRSISEVLPPRWGRSARPRRATKLLPHIRRFKYGARSPVDQKVHADDTKTCVGCQATPPLFGEDTTLLSLRGWRLTRAKAADGSNFMEWRCPGCWSKFRSAPKVKTEADRRCALPRPVAIRGVGSRNSPVRANSRLRAPRCTPGETAVEHRVGSTGIRREAPNAWLARASE
jgi:hypothetical protein